MWQRRRLLWTAMAGVLICMALYGAERPAWTWTLEERLGVRLDPHASAERARLYVAKRKSEMRAFKSTTADDSNQFVIEGSENPELFLTWELMDSLLAAATRDPARQSYRSWIALFGWNYDSFWAGLKTSADEYAMLQERIVALQREAQSNERRLQNPESEYLKQQFCAARANALESAHRRFGEAQFDEFLYRAVAPRITLTAQGPVDAATLVWIQGACK